MILSFRAELHFERGRAAFPKRRDWGRGGWAQGEGSLSVSSSHLGLCRAAFLLGPAGGSEGPGTAVYFVAPPHPQHTVSGVIFLEELGLWVFKAASPLRRTRARRQFLLCNTLLQAMKKPSPTQAFVQLIPFSKLSPSPAQPHYCQVGTSPVGRRSQKDFPCPRRFGLRVLEQVMNIQSLLQYHPL